MKRINKRWILTCAKCGRPKGKSDRPLCVACAHWGISTGPISEATRKKLSTCAIERFKDKNNHPRFGTGKYPDKKTSGRAGQLRRKYGLSLEEYGAMLAHQGGVCAICGKSRIARAGQPNLHVDHDHSTHLIRGLLCWPCNKLLPARRNLASLLTSAVAYLSNPPALNTIGARYAGKPRLPRS